MRWIEVQTMYEEPINHHVPQERVIPTKPCLKSGAPIVNRLRRVCPHCAYVADRRKRGAARD